mgnify:CR=1 FL=1
MNLNKKINSTATNATTVYISKWVIGVCAMVIASAANAEWQLDPVLRVGWDYDDNAAMSIRTDGEEQISGPVAEAAVDIRSDTETSYISLRPMARTRNYEDQYNRDSDDGFLRMRWGLDREKHTLRSEVNYALESVRTAELGGDDFDFESDPGDIADDDTGRVGLRQRRERLRILPRWTYRFSDVSAIVAESNFLNVTYEDQPEETNLFDYTDARFTLSYRHALSQTNTGILSVTGRDFQTDNVDGGDSTGYGVSAGFNRKWSQTTQLRALLGVEQTDLNNESLDQEDPDPSFVTEVSLLRQLETTRLLAQYRQRIAASGRGGLRRRSEVNLSLARDLNDKISAGIGFRAYTIDVIEGAAKEQDYVQLRGQFVWRMTPALSIQANYIHTLLDRRDLGESANSNRFTLWFSYQPTPRGRLRPATVL